MQLKTRYNIKTDRWELGYLSEGKFIVMASYPNLRSSELNDGVAA